ncbi:unnamed protein product [Eruca vesicaria subsp. sativa]|uniref:F-box domain-containing protein n=1 Tax=Eruca vesicaria subsp. sativa TaxID=29727 RepID=A0ABC8KTD0_ERUVS|nr:unnamed protein product [Eruca vesicaria subsp. sativa]
MSRFFAQGGGDSKDEDMEEVIQEIQNTDINNRTISHLPLEIMDHILSFLPTKVAARTPSLSKGWRDVFYRTPTLRIELNDETRDVIPFIRFVDRIVAVRRRDPTLHLRNGLSESILVASFLVELKISTADEHLMCIASNVKVHLPNLKILSVDMVDFGDDGKGFYNLLKDDRDHRPASVSSVTPKLVYLNYNDDTAANYKDLDFASLVEAKILLHLRGEKDKKEDKMEVAQEEDASDFLDAICNVKKLFLHADTLRGLTHQAKITCGNVCRCEGGLVAKAYCLQASPVKVLKVYDFGQATKEIDRFVAMMNHFLVNMAQLERFIVYCDGNDETRHDLLIRIQGKASPNCRNQVLYKKAS